MAKMDSEQEGLKWQVGVWDRISPIYLRAIDNRFTGVVDAVTAGGIAVGPASARSRHRDGLGSDQGRPFGHAGRERHCGRH